MDERLWNEVAASFLQRFADNLAKEKAQSLLRKGIKMKGKDIDSYIAEFEEAVRMAKYRFDIPQTIETFTEGLPTRLYQKILELNQPHSYEQWKQAAINQQQVYMHMKARLRVHRGGNAPTQPRGWAPTQQLSNPNAMDTSARRTRGRIAGSEEMNPATMPCGGYIPCGGFMQQGRGGARQRDLSKVECYTCHKKGHLSRNCPQHTWNRNPNQWNKNQLSSQGREAIMDDWSIAEEESTAFTRSATQTPQQSADA